MSRIHRNHLFVLASIAMVLVLVTLIVTPASGAGVEETTASEPVIVEAGSEAEASEEMEAPAVETVPEPEVPATEDEAPVEAEPATASEVPVASTGGKAKLLKAKVREQRGGGGNPNNNSNNNNNNQNPTDPPGNNGDTKITDGDATTFGGNHNEPKPGCSFYVEFDGYGTLASLTFQITTQSPSSPAGETVFGPQQVTLTGGFGEYGPVNLSPTLDAYTFQQNQGHHLQVENAPNTTGVKTKTFYIDCAPNADLSITKTDTPDPVFTNGSFSYTLTAANSGPSNASGVTVSDTLPEGVLFSSFGTATLNNCVHDDGEITCTHGTMASGASASVVVNVTAPATAGAVSNTATVSATTADRYPGDNNATAITTIIDEPENPTVDLQITKTDSADPFDIDSGLLTYTLEVKNNGPDTAHNVYVVDELPDGVDFDSSGGDAFCIDGDIFGGLFGFGGPGDVTCFVFEPIEPGETATITIVVDPTETGTLENTAYVEMLPCFIGEGGFGLRRSVIQNEFPPFCDIPVDTNPSNNSATEFTEVVDGGIDLAISKTDHRESIELGSGNLTYELVVTNEGDETAHNVIVEDQLPADADFVGFGIGQECSYDSGEHTVICSLGSVSNEDTITLTIEVTPTAVGTLSNEAEVHDLGVILSRVASNQNSQFFTPETNNDNNFAGDTTIVTGRFVPPEIPETPEADLSITKVDSADPVTVGGDFTYTLSVFNNGPARANSVIVTDVLPAETSFVSAISTTPGVTCDSVVGVSGSDVVTCRLASLASQNGFDVSVVVTADAVGAVVNTASATSVTTDPDPSDNTDSEGTVIGEPIGGRIVIQKQTLPHGAANVFAFDGAIVADLGDDESATVEVDPGTYSVVEQASDGWELTRIECVDSDDSGTASTGSIAQATARFNVEAGETVTCVFTNVKEEVKGGVIGPPGPDRPDGPESEDREERPATRGSRVLPFTGWAGAGLPQLAIIMVLGGLALLVIVRRRRTRG